MVLLAAVGSALCYGVAMVLQHRSAQSVDRSRWMRLGMLTFLGRQPLWWLGVIANGLAVVLRLLALGHGSLIVVQAILCTSLLFALPVSAFWHRQRLSGSAVFGGFCVAIGLVAFIHSQSSTDNGRVPFPSRWTVPIAVLIGVAAAAMIAGNRIQRATFYAISGGCLLALTGALMKTVADEMTIGVRELPTTYPIYALGFSAALAVLVVQSAFAAGPLVASLPALLATEVIGTAFIARVVFQERAAQGSSSLFALFAFALLVIGVAATARATAATALTVVPAAQGDGVR